MTPVAAGSRDLLRGADFIDIARLTPEQLTAVLDLAGDMKSGHWLGRPLTGRALALIFQKPSMRTRVSFQVAIERLGGKAVPLSEQEIGLGTQGRGEGVATGATAGRLIRGLR